MAWRNVMAAALLLVSVARLAAQSPTNTLSASDRAAGWRLLFDGSSTTGWRGYKTDSVPAAWHVIDGVLTKAVDTGDIMTRDEYQDFELRFDWKIGAGGNSGVFYRGTNEFEHIYWTGPEYQLLDDAAAPDGKNRLTAAGAAYGLYPAPAGIVKAAGEWNSSRIVVKGNHVEHWMNGQKLLEYELLSPDWTAKVAASKFGVWPKYGRETRGHIGIQGDHDGVLALRNIMIRELR
jgi:Domain of Unknown Function (DUF1080)